jgi:hypothetical protein
MKVLLGELILDLPIIYKNKWLIETNLLNKYKDNELIQDCKGNYYDIYKTTNNQLVLVKED